MKYKIIAAIIAIVIIGAIASCATSSCTNSNDGKCDICGAKATLHYAGHEMCSSCYIAMNKHWDETH